jgi:hypothetical protein
MESQPLARLGLSSAALKAAVLAELDQRRLGEDAEVIASAVADAIDANNQELFRQLRHLLSVEADDVVAVVGPEPAEEDG